MRDLPHYAALSLSAKTAKSYECNILLEVDGEKFRAYEVSVAHQDLLFFTEKGTVNYVVDNYSGRPVIELFSVERD